MQRTIQIADFELPRGPITIGELLGMDRPTWEHLRSEITRRRTKNPDTPLARCRLCRKGIYIKAQATPDGHSPLFAHFSDQDSDCPWYQGNNLVPDDARAAQYQGHQERALHRWMCDAIADILRKDWRASNIRVDAYHRPKIEERGRYPDVYVELEGVGKFAIEVQLSKPFTFEIAARHLYYQAEGVALIWVFRDLADTLPQGFRDVITMQRGNAFLFDDAALAASLDRGALTFSCLLESDQGWLKPRLAELTDINRGTGRAMFLEDRRSARLLKFCEQAREKWWAALEVGRPFDFHDVTTDNQFGPCWDSIVRYVPRLSGWKDAWWHHHHSRGRPHFLDLMAILFSILKSAETDKDVIYITRYKDENRLLAMLNARLSNASYLRYADLIETMLDRTAARQCLERASL